MKYVVIKDFLDRFDNNRHCRPGEPHEPPSEQRAKQLLDQGFISEVKEDKPEKKPGRKKKDEEVKPEGDPDGKASTDE